MAVNEVKIVNMALGRLGITTETITSLTEQTKAGRLAALWYEPCRDEVLSVGRWPFAVARATLATHADDADAPWIYKYRLPSDCLQPIMLDDGVTPVHHDLRLAYVVESGGVLQADVTPAVLLYVKKITDTTLFPMDFVSALAWRIAMEFAMPYAVSTALGDRALQQYRLALTDARARAANSQQARVPADPESVQARA